MSIRISKFACWINHVNKINKELDYIPPFFPLNETLYVAQNLTLIQFKPFYPQSIASFSIKDISNQPAKHAPNKPKS